MADFKRAFKSKLPGLISNQVGNMQGIVITKLNEKVNTIYKELISQCPPAKELEQMAKVISIVETLISKTDKRIAKLNSLPKKLDKPIQVGQIALEFIKNIPIPSTIGTPPGPAGGVIVSTPLGVIQKQAQTVQFIDNMVNVLADDKDSIQDILDTAQSVFGPIKTKISVIQDLLYRCTVNPNLTQEERDAVLASVGNKQEQGLVENLDEPYKSAGGNTYTISIKVDKENSTTAPRRQAVVKDFRGIVVLTGPLSFAGSAQVLKDEIKFRIDNQLP